MASASAVQSSQCETLIERILTPVATREECDVVELPSLYEAIDTENLAQIIDSPGVDEVEFRYHDYTVTIDGDGTVQVASA